MPLETGTQIGDLDPANPPGTDPLSQADDHLRLIKTCVQGSLGDMEALWAIPTNDTPLRARNAADDAYIDLINLTASDRRTIPGDLHVTDGDVFLGNNRALKLDTFAGAATTVLGMSISDNIFLDSPQSVNIRTGAGTDIGLQVDTSQNVVMPAGNLTIDTGDLNIDVGNILLTSASLQEISVIRTGANAASAILKNDGNSGKLVLSSLTAPDVILQANSTVFEIINNSILGLSVASVGDVAIPNGDLTVADGDVILGNNRALKLDTFAGAATEVLRMSISDNIFLDSPQGVNIRTGAGTDIGLQVDTSQNVAIPNGDLTVTNDVIVGLVKSDNATGSLVMSGGTTSSLGGVISLRGQSHSSQASDIVFLAAGSTVGKYDFSQTTWVFNEDVDIDAQCIIRNDEGKLEVNHTEAGGNPVINLKLTGTTKCYWTYLTSTSTVKFSNNSGKAFKFIDNFGVDVMALDSGGKLTIKDLAGTGTKSLLVDENGLIFRGP
jgi:hypothetical protein